MAWSYRIDAARGVVFTSAPATLTDTRLSVGVMRTIRDPLFRPEYRGLFDFSRVTRWRVTYGFLARLAEARKLTPKARTAILVADALGFGMSRYYQAFVSHGEVRVFTERTAAVAWLNQGLPPAHHIE